MKRHMISFFVANILFLSISIGAMNHKWDAVRNNTAFTINVLLDEASNPIQLAPDDIIYTNFHGWPAGFRIPGRISGWVKPDNFGTLDQEIVDGEKMPANRGKVPVLYISSYCLGCGWSFGIVWEDKGAFTKERDKRRSEGWRY